MKHIGIDGCKDGWFYICLDDNQSNNFGILNSINNLSLISNKSDIVLIDIPIGLREKEQQVLCDNYLVRLTTINLSGYS